MTPGTDLRALTLHLTALDARAEELRTEARRLDQEAASLFDMLNDVQFEQVSVLMAEVLGPQREREAAWTARKIAKIVRLA